MTAAEPRSIGVVVEAPADGETVGILVDRVLLHAADWVAEELLPHLRSWRGFEPGTSVAYWKDVRKLCAQHGVRGAKVHGKFGGEPREPDAYAARRALMLFSRLGMPDAVVLVRDADNQPERLAGLAQGRERSAHPERVAIGVAVPEREAWHITGFSPCSAAEREALRAQRKRLGFDPTMHADQLRGEDKRSAKLVLQALTGGDHDRARGCLTEPTLEVLEERGAGCGLTAFLEEVRARVATVLV